MNPIRSDILRQQMMAQIKELDIAGYITEEIESLLDHMHYYKLKNMYENIESLKDFLLFLDHQNTQQISQLTLEEGYPTEIDNVQIHYYVSKTGLEILDEVQISLVSTFTHELQTLMMSIKGLLLLTADEFCCATPTRMWIKQKELQEVM